MSYFFYASCLYVCASRRPDVLLMADTRGLLLHLHSTSCDTPPYVTQYFKNHIVYYAGPAKTPEGMSSGYVQRIFDIVFSRIGV